MYDPLSTHDLDLSNTGLAHQTLAGEPVALPPTKSFRYSPCGTYRAFLRDNSVSIEHLDTLVSTDLTVTALDCYFSPNGTYLCVYERYGINLMFSS